MLEHLETIMGADTVDVAWRAHTQNMARYGFDRLIYGLSYEMGRGGLGPLEDMMVLSNHPAAYLQRFITEGLFRDAPMLKWAQSNLGAASWSSFQGDETTLEPRERDVIAFNRQMGVIAGYTISLGRTPPCGRAVISLTAHARLDQDAVDDIWAENGREIELFNRVAHLKIANLPRTRFARQLTPRQREVLQLIGAGKTASEIAGLMGVSQVTIEKHLRLAREQLGADTSAQALLRAAVQGQIFVSQGSDQPESTT
ncbi:MAG: LuxR family transcriptional regulator [Pseudomonadota bacterium]